MGHTKESLSEEVKLYNAYHKWLMDLIMYREMKKSGRTYNKLIQIMKRKPFTVIVPNDINRVNDGKNLRYMFSDYYGCTDDAIKGSCSFLEMCIALSVRIHNDIFEHDIGSKPARWFWIMMENCGLDRCTDDDFDETIVNNIIDRIISRRYSKTGKGGLFPLKHPNKDQKEVEIWYQMQQYVIENFD